MGDLFLLEIEYGDLGSETTSYDIRTAWTDLDIPYNLITKVKHLLCLIYSINNADITVIKA